MFCQNGSNLNEVTEKSVTLLLQLNAFPIVKQTVCVAVYQCLVKKNTINPFFLSSGLNFYISVCIQIQKQGDHVLLMQHMLTYNTSCTYLQ